MSKVSSNNINSDNLGKNKPNPEFIEFKKGDLLKVLAGSPNGWWFGYRIDTQYNQNEAEVKKGFFPSNYVRILRSGDPEFQPKEFHKKNEKNMVYKGNKGSYAEYVNSTFADKDQVINKNYFSRI